MTIITSIVDSQGKRLIVELPLPPLLREAKKFMLSVGMLRFKRLQMDAQIMYMKDDERENKVYGSILLFTSLKRQPFFFSSPSWILTFGAYVFLLFWHF